MSKYSIDSGEGRFTIQAFAEGLLSSFGHSPTMSVRNFSGEVDFDSATAQTASVSVAVQAGSLEVTGDVNKKDRQEIEFRLREEVLEVSKYPRITFRSESVEAKNVGENQFLLHASGKLYLHGVEKDESIELRIRVSADDLRLRGEITLKQSQYRIQRVSAVGGAIRVKDDVKLSFELVAKRLDT